MSWKLWNDAGSDFVALTLDAFLPEHGDCWRVSGFDMENSEDESVVCPGCGASVTGDKKRCPA